MSLDRIISGKIPATIFSLFIGLVVAIATKGILLAGNGGGLSALHLDNFLFRILLIAAPFLGFGLLGVTARASWIYGIIFTAVLWGGYVYDSLTRMDANIGLGMVLLASPLIILAMGLLTERKKNQGD